MDWALHKARHLVENAFAKLEQFRTVDILRQDAAFILHKVNNLC